MLKDMIDLSHRAGDMALAVHRRKEAMTVEQKIGPLDVVTQTDRDIEDFLRTEVARRFPGLGFLGEEGGAIPGAVIGKTWVVDPIDGTANFVRHSSDWAVSIGLYEGDEAIAGVIHAPALGVTLAGEKGRGASLNGTPLPSLPQRRSSNGMVSFEVASDTSPAFQSEVVRLIREGDMMCRSCGSSTISFLSVARGFADVHLGFDCRSWDIMAGIAILSVLGAEVQTSRPLSELHKRFNVFAGCAEEAERWRDLISRSLPSKLP